MQETQFRGAQLAETSLATAHTAPHRRHLAPTALGASRNKRCAILRPSHSTPSRLWRPLADPGRRPGQPRAGIHANAAGAGTRPCQATTRRLRLVHCQGVRCQMPCSGPPHHQLGLAPHHGHAPDGRGQRGPEGAVSQRLGPTGLDADHRHPAARHIGGRLRPPHDGSARGHPVDHRLGRGGHPQDPPPWGHQADRTRREGEGQRAQRMVAGPG